MYYDYRRLPEYQGNSNVTADTKCWGIVVSYEDSDGQQMIGKEDWLDAFKNLTFSEAEQKTAELNKQLKDNT